MILQSIQTLESRFQVIAYLSVLTESDRALELCRFLPSSQERGLVEAVREILTLPEKERKILISKRLKQLVQRQNLKPIAEIHPGWFVDILREESPQTVAVILKNLPNQDAKYILEQFSEDLRKQVSVLDRASPVSDQVTEIVRKKFESRFLTLVPPQKSSQLNLSDLYFLKLEKLLEFFRDLGMEQLARAFKNLHVNALRAFLNRLSVRDIKDFQVRLKGLGDLTSKQLKESQMLLLNLSIDTIAPENLFLEVGIAFFTKGIKREEKEFVRAMRFKLPPKLGYLLNRYFEEYRKTAQPLHTELIQKQVLDQFQKFPLV